MGDNPTRLLIIAASRSGSHFLCHALDSHSQIGCARYEPLDANANPHYDQHDNHGARISTILGWSGYQVTACKLSYRQARYLSLSRLPLWCNGLIHLHRKNVVQTVVSAMVNTASLDGRPSHTYEALPPAQIEVDPVLFIYECERYEGNVKAMRKELAALNLPIRYMVYEDIVGSEGVTQSAMLEPTAAKLCKWLGLVSERLQCRLVRTNPYPLTETIVNWPDVAARVADTRYGEFIQPTRIS